MVTIFITSHLTILPPLVNFLLYLLRSSLLTYTCLLTLLFHSLLIVMNLSLKKVILESHWTFMDLSCCLIACLVEFFQRGPWSGYSLLSWILTLLSCFFCTAPSSQDPNSAIPWSLQPKLPLTFTPPVCSSLFVNARGPVERLFSSVQSLSVLGSCHHSKNLLDFLCSVVLPFQQTLRWSWASSSYPKKVFFTHSFDLQQASTKALVYFPQALNCLVVHHHDEVVWNRCYNCRTISQQHQTPLL